MNLELLERQRIRIYKDYLRQEAETNIRKRKSDNHYNHKKQEANINEIISRLNDDDVKLGKSRNSSRKLESGNFWGQYGRERQQQINYVDRKLGLRIPADRYYSPNNLPQKNKQKYSLNNEQQQGVIKSDENQHYIPPAEQRQQKRQAPQISIPSIASMHQGQKNNRTPRNTGILENNGTPRNIKEPSEERKVIPIASGDPGNSRLNGVSQPGERKLFRSFDLVTGHNRFYG